MPKVTVVIPSYNHAEFIATAILSVLDQTYQDFDILICDDASSDNSVEIIKQFNDARITLIVNEKNMGACYGHNLMIERSCGEYVALLNSDDVWLPNKLAIQVEFLDKNPQYVAVFSDVLLIDEHGIEINDPNHFHNLIFKQKNRSRAEWLKHFVTNGNCLCHPSVLIRRAVYPEIGPYNILMASFPDFEMWVRLCIKYDIYVLSDKLVKFRMLNYGQNASGNNTANIVRLHFESLKILDVFYSMDDIALFNLMFPNRMVDNVDLIPLRFAQYVLNDRRHYLRLSGLNKLYELLANNYDYYSQFISAAQFIQLSSSFDALNVFNLRDCFVQLYYDTGTGFNEQNMLQKDVSLVANQYEFDLSGIIDLRALRLDPANLPCRIKWKFAYVVIQEQQFDLAIKEINASQVDNEYFYFAHNDSIIILNIPELHGKKISKLMVAFEVSVLTMAEQSVYIHNMENKIHDTTVDLCQKDQDLISANNELQQLHQKVETLQNSINDILSSRSWRVMAPLRWLVKKSKVLC